MAHIDDNIVNLPFVQFFEEYINEQLGGPAASTHLVRQQCFVPFQSIHLNDSFSCDNLATLVTLRTGNFYAILNILRGSRISLF